MSKNYYRGDNKFNDRVANSGCQNLSAELTAIGFPETKITQHQDLTNDAEKIELSIPIWEN